MNRLLMLKQDCNDSILSNQSNRTVDYDTAMEDNTFSSSLYYSMNEKTLEPSCNESIGSVIGEGFCTESCIDTVKKNNPLIATDTNLNRESSLGNISTPKIIISDCQNMSKEFHRLPLTPINGSNYSATLNVSDMEISPVSDLSASELHQLTPQIIRNHSTGSLVDMEIAELLPTQKESNEIARKDSDVMTSTKLTQIAQNNSTDNLENIEPTNVLSTDEIDLNKINKPNDVPLRQSIQPVVQITHPDTIQYSNNSVKNNIQSDERETKSFENIKNSTESNSTSTSINPKMKNSPRKLVNKKTPQKRQSLIATILTRQKINRTSVSTTFRQTTKILTNELKVESHVTTKRSVAVEKSKMPAKQYPKRATRLTIASDSKSEKELSDWSDVENEFRRELRSRRSVMPTFSEPSTSSSNSIAKASTSSIGSKANRKSVMPALTCRHPVKKPTDRAGALSSIKESSFNPPQRKFIAKSPKSTSNLRRVSLRISSPSITRPRKSITSRREMPRKSMIPKLKSDTDEQKFLKPMSYLFCDICQKTFVLQSTLLKHKKMHENLNAQEHHNCPHCKKQFSFKSALSTHLKENCLKISFDERRKLLTPKTDDQQYSAERKKVRPSARQSSAQKSMGASGIRRTPNKPIKCGVCASLFMDPVSFALHGETHSITRNIERKKLF